MLSAVTLPAVGLVARPAWTVHSSTSATARACARAVVADVERAPPAGFFWGFDSTSPAAALVEPEPTPLERFAFGSYDASTTTITEDEVRTAQNNWASAIKTISAVHKEGGDFVGSAGAAAGELYGYGSSLDVLFKPTKATDHPFRPTGSEAMSYFIGGDNIDGGYVGEDKGFAINGGRG